ncbi:Cullin binding-domain-containing protein [Lasiosphaeria ovina]|uniref:Defective in cullin neddylation protein n=1 Tax=Lasiosphaeria ovina TaxID=92902 RepID=A0AAE0JRW7_9PEZI|nr:Cullin binding-domain-containing protein [Lasiosphaeria ovina]
MASSDSIDSRVMVLQLFTSCFQKRPDRTQPKSLGQGDGAVETESEDTNIQPLQTPSQPRNHAKSSSQSGTDRPPDPESLPKSHNADESKFRKLKSAVKSKPKSVLVFMYLARGEVETEESRAAEYKKTVENKLGQMFDGFLSNQDKVADKNVMGAESIENYMNTLGADHLSHEAFVVLEIVKAEGIGQISRDGFVAGWSKLALETDRSLRVPVDISAHKRHVQSCIEKLPHDPSYFKQVYQRVFFVGKEPQVKAMDTPVAFVFWETLLGPELHPWKTPNIDWLRLWKTFIDEVWRIEEDKYKRGVNKDMWNQTLEFANKTMTDETLSFWSENQAWPGIIDDFVAWCQRGGFVATKKDGMEVDGDQ